MLIVELNQPVTTNSVANILLLFRPLSSPQKDVRESENDACCRYKRRKTVADNRRVFDGSLEAMGELCIDFRGVPRAQIRACTDEEHDYDQEGLKVEQS